MRTFIFIVCIPAAFCATISERAMNCNHILCGEIYSPVCGTDGITYSNPCELGIATCKDATVTEAHKGRCGGVGRAADCPEACFANWQPVCGSNGKTYGNYCELNGAACRDNSITLSHDGPCARDLLVS